MRNLLILIIIIFTFNSCQLVINPIRDFINGKKKEHKENEAEKTKFDPNKTYVVKSYYEKSGTLKSEISVRNKKKNGPSKKYYPTGELHTLVYYVDNITHGETVWYYKNGNPYRVTPYEKGKMHGIRKIYYENGKLQAEIPYKNGELEEGTKEYERSGSLITNYPLIIFETENLLKYENKYTLKVKLSKKINKPEFFQEKTSVEGYKVLVPVKTNQSGTGKIEFLVPKGNSVITTVKVYAKFKTRLRNPILISSSYNLVAENK